MKPQYKIFCDNLDSLDYFGIEAGRNQGKTGVWIDIDTPFPKKICAMGVRASRWVTMHGFALNLNPDMKYYDGMIPCGIQEYGITSLFELGLNSA